MVYIVLQMTSDLLVWVHQKQETAGVSNLWLRSCV